MPHIVLSGNTAWSMYNFRAGLIRFLLEKGYNVSVIAPKDEVFDRKIESLGAAFIPMAMQAKGTNPIADISLFFRMRKTLRSLNPDMAFFYTIKPNIYGSFAARTLSIPHIAITTGLGYIFLNDSMVSKIARKLYKWAFRSAKEVWFLNADDVESFLEYKLIPASKRFILRGEGINLERFAPSNNQQEKVSFLLMARMLWDKGVGEFVEAARILKKKYPQTTFKLLGFMGVENPSAIPPEQMQEWQAEGVVEYLGSTTDVVPFVREASCLVLPSYREGIPITLLEAAAMCKPIVTTRCVGCRETVDDGTTGFLCQVKSVPSLVDAMERTLLMSPEERQKMGECGRAKMQREFDEKLIFDAYLRAVTCYQK